MGTPEIPSPPWESNGHSCSGDVTPPANRQLIPTITIGSPSAGTTATGRDVSGIEPSSSASKNPANARGVGSSNTSVAGTINPVAAPNALRNAPAVNEANPTSITARSAPTVTTLPLPSNTAHVQRRTS